ncbi:AraC family transcriptional regulator [Deinococcus aestuarii]|uniref:AraC family transcriptional regulator n=1 Tax=Deinococcus aestuarii TaxID=2774531 RepID=UPI001C0D2DF8|nr:AraC family transcriptional regulator [Deinococcus aestuarii]
MTPTNTTLPLPQLDPLPGPGAGDLSRLAGLIRAFTPYDGEFPLRLPGVAVARSTRVHGHLQHSVQPSALCLVAQGNKSVQIGPDTYEYDPHRLMVYSVHLPVAFRVTRASAREPFLTFKLDLDPGRIAALSLRLFPHGLTRVQDRRGVHVTPSNAAIVNAATRLLEAMGDEREAAFIGPLIVDELLTRLLLSPVGAQVAQLGQAESRVGRVARAIEWIYAHYDEPLEVEALAAFVHLGVSTFHAHFKAVTSMSPLQFQKTVRLQEARRLMMAAPVDAATAGRQVGYQSASQFSREYSRLFGNTPARDSARLRGPGGGRVAPL